MNVNGINSSNISDVYAANTSEKEKTQNQKEETSQVTEDGAVYEKSKMSESERASLVKQLQADADKRQAQLQELVTNMMSKQTNVYGQANNMWKFLASGNFTVDAATKKKAQEDISEDGYWGVKQTSDRIIDFAKALAGDDTQALEKMKAAFEKGYKKAEKTWGGKLPDISQRTREAVMEKFDKLLSKANEEQASVTIKENTANDNETGL